MRLFLVGSVVLVMVMVTCFGNVLTFLLLKFVKILSFIDLMRMDKSHWSRCLFWHGWLPLLSGTGGGSPWAVGADDAAVHMLENASGSYSSNILQGWDVPSEC